MRISKANAVTMQIEGVEDLREMLTEVAPSTARSILRQTVHGIAGQLRDLMKQKVPVRTGKLRKSIKAVRRRGTPDNPVSEVRGGSDAPYMHLVEWGVKSKNIKAQPFMVPSIEEMRSKLKSVYREEFGKRLEKALARAAKRKARKASKEST